MRGEMRCYWYYKNRIEAENSETYSWVLDIRQDLAVREKFPLRTKLQIGK